MSTRMSLRRRLRLRASRKAAFLVSRLRLQQMDTRAIPTGDNELRLFCMARNEALRLPWFLEYYLSRGVDRVFLIDNGSTDDTLATALAHDNVHVFCTHESFTRYSNWMEIMLNHHGVGHWCLAADIDELFMYPGAEKLSIRDLCSYLDQQGETAVHAVLLDMYSQRPIRDNRYQPGQDPLEVCAWFDPHFERGIKHWRNEETLRRFAFERYTGNLRRRVFGVEVNLTKVPLFRYGPGVFAARGMHAMDGVRLSSLRGAVLHFKYLQDFNRRVIEEAARGEHEGNAAAYRKYAARVLEQDDVNCHFEGSQRFVDSHQLVGLGLMSEPDALRTFIAARAPRLQAQPCTRPLARR
jgi:hypothetical protein